MHHLRATGSSTSFCDLTTHCETWADAKRLRGEAAFKPKQKSCQLAVPLAHDYAARPQSLSRHLAAYRRSSTARWAAVCASSDSCCRSFLKLGSAHLRLRSCRRFAEGRGAPPPLRRRCCGGRRDSMALRGEVRRVSAMPHLSSPEPAPHRLDASARESP